MGVKGFDERLMKVRKELGITQEDLARKIGVTPQAISKWERGISFPDIDLLSHICELLGYSADYFLGVSLSSNKLTETEDEKQKRQLLQNILAEPFLLEAGSGFIPMLMEESRTKFESIQMLREKLASNYGILMPIIRIRDAMELSELEYRVVAYDKVIGSKVVKSIQEITFSDICNHLEEISLRYYSTIINRQIVKTLIDNVESKYPAVIRGVIPEKFTISFLQKVLCELLGRGNSIHNLVKIIETVEEELEYTRDLDMIVHTIQEKLK
ncbi:MAG: transcriptional regulator, family [Herbinix sp.]|jgi:flagellar biosynthesis component FlhA/DNA-binding Xre family transcriptional regulator|nr:transcriptional regulator, family [Herbinix sp.]